jgi:hypothetical protein
VVIVIPESPTLASEAKFEVPQAVLAATELDGAREGPEQDVKRRSRNDVTAGRIPQRIGRKPPDEVALDRIVPWPRSGLDPKILL